MTPLNEEWLITLRQGLSLTLYCGTRHIAEQRDLWLWTQFSNQWIPILQNLSSFSTLDEYSRYYHFISSFTSATCQTLISKQLWDTLVLHYHIRPSTTSQVSSSFFKLFVCILNHQINNVCVWIMLWTIYELKG